MSNTAGLNIANIQVYAEAVAALDRVAGTFEANQQSDPRYYIWQSEFQTIPMGMHGNPEQFVQKLLLAIPGVNCLRIPFNAHSFNADGSLNPLFERFLIAAAKAGLQLLPVVADGDAQSYAGTQHEITEALAGQTFDRLREAWTNMKAWMDAHPEVEAAVYGWELVNEPAAYRQAVQSAPEQERAAVQVELLELYVSHMAALADIVSAGSDARILVSAWGYGGDTETLTSNLSTGNTAIEALREAIGEDLVWSLHFYPGWIGTGNITEPGVLQERWAEFIAPLGHDDIIMTEINAPGTTTYNPFQNNQITTATALALEWLKTSGIGIGWFPAVQTGSSGLALIEAGGGIRYLNQPSLAAALNAFSFGQEAPIHDHDELVELTLINAKLRNQVSDIDYVSSRIDSVKFAGFGFGHGGDDTIIGSMSANNFLYGGTGEDRILGSSHDDFLFGQDGNDFIISGDGIDHLFGGNGNDTLVAQNHNSAAYGGSGADTFVLMSGASLTIADYTAGHQDSWIGPARGQYLGFMLADANNDGVADLRVSFSDRSEALFISVGGMTNALAVLEGLRWKANSISDTVGNLYQLAGLISSVSQSSPHAEEHGTTLAAQTLTVGVGADSIIGDSRDQVVHSLAGRDTVYGESGHDLIDGGVDSDLLFGGDGNDTLLGGNDNDSVFGNGGNDSVIGGIGQDFIAGGDGNDTMFGNHGNDVVSGGGGSDHINGGEGNDALFGGNGSDFIFASKGSDQVDGGSGTDTLIFNERTAISIDLRSSVTQSWTNGTVKLGSIENVTSGSASDTLLGNANANVLRGRGGNDTIRGGGNSDSLYGGEGDDGIWGGTGNDLIEGGPGNDRIVGANGNDTLIGGHGSDTMSGGAGADVFVFNVRPTRAVDRVRDFNPLEDTINLKMSIFEGLHAGLLNASAFVRNSSGAALDANDRIIYQTSTGNVFYDRDGNGPSAKVLIVDLQAALNITSEDFLFY